MSAAKSSIDAPVSPINPLADYVVATRQEAPSKTASGLYLPDNAKEKPVIAVVGAVGPEVKGVEVGDRIINKDYTSTELKIDGTIYLLIKESDVLATIA